MVTAGVCQFTHVGHCANTVDISDKIHVPAGRVNIFFNAN